MKNEMKHVPPLGPGVSRHVFIFSAVNLEFDDDEDARQQQNCVNSPVKPKHPVFQKHPPNRRSQNESFSDA